MKPVMGVYKIQNRVNGKLYVGSAIDIARRFQDHRRDLRTGKHHSIKLQRAFNKSGAASFEFTLIETVASRELLVSREQHYIDALLPSYNILKIAYNSTGYRHSQTAKERIRAALVGRTNPMLGRHHSASAIAKITARSNELKNSPKALAALALGQGWNRGRPWPESTRARMRAAKKPRRVERVAPTTGEVVAYESATSAKRDGFSPSRIGHCCAGSRPMYRGYQWRYAA